jgi:hypothetical protein
MDRIVLTSLAAAVVRGRHERGNQGELRMTRWRRIGTMIVAGAAVLAVSASTPPRAEAWGHGGFHGHAYFGGFYGWGPYWGFGWGPWFGPYWGPYGYAPPGGIDLGMALMAGFGAVDMNVKPNHAEVWVDGKYMAEARDLDGYPSYLWLKGGAHHVVVYKGGYEKFEEDVEVQPGFKRELKIRLEKGDSTPPGPRPGEKPPAESKPAKPAEKKY